MRVEYHRKAQFELREAVAWYDERRNGLGLEFFRAVEEIVGRLAAYPQQFPVWPRPRVEKHRELRRAILDRFPYEIVFQIRVESLLIVAVAHLKRRPFYWLDRSV